MRSKKSNVFLQKTTIFLLVQKGIDKPGSLCLNGFNIKNDVDGKSVLSDFAAESRWVVRTGASAKGDLIPESVL